MVNDNNGKELLDEVADVTQTTDAKESDDDNVIWSSHQVVRKNKDRRVNSNRRHFISRGITVPDMRGGVDRRTGEDRRKVKLTITGRAIDV